MAGRPPKSLLAHVRDGGFRPGRHHQLLAGPDLPWPGLALLQQRYRSAASDPERRAIAVEFLEAARLLRTENESASLAAELAVLGRPGSFAQLTGFAGGYLVHPTGPLVGRSFVLEPWQLAFLREAYRRDKRGRRVYRLVVLGLPRGCAKTLLAAAVAVFELVGRTDAPEIVLAAGSREQAGIGFGFARGFVDAGRLAESVVVKGSSLWYPAGRGELTVVSAEGRLQHGRAPAVAVIDELWTFETERQEQTYVALSSALHKREDSFLLVTSTAGYDQESLLGRIYHAALKDWPDVTVSQQGCLTIAKDEPNGMLLYWYGAPNGCDLEDEQLWRASNPASWIRLDALRRQLHDPGLGDREFRRLHLNQFVQSRDAWLPDGCWDELAGDKQFPERASIYVGVDVGLTHDTTAVCWAHKDGDGEIFLRAHVFSARDDAPAHTYVEGGRIELEQIEAFIRELVRRHRIEEIAYDPRFFARSAELLERSGHTMLEYLSNSAPMTTAYQTFFQLAREGRLTHDGDPVFAAHIHATAARKTSNGWKLSKLRSNHEPDRFRRGPG